MNKLLIFISLLFSYSLYGSQLQNQRLDGFTLNVSRNNNGRVELSTSLLEDRQGEIEVANKLTFYAIRGDRPQACKMVFDSFVAVKKYAIDAFNTSIIQFGIEYGPKNIRSFPLE